MTETAISYLGILLGVLSVCATAYFAIRFSERKDPRYFFLSEEKIARSREPLGDILIQYRGRNVSRVTSTYVWFWNKGRRPIRHGDIPDSQPITVELRETSLDLEILSAEIRAVSRPAIDFKVTQRSERELDLSFDFLDQSDGAAVEIRHTGSEAAAVELSGIVLGSARGVRSVKMKRGRTKRLHFPLRRVLSRRSLSQRVKLIMTALVFASVPSVFLLIEKTPVSADAFVKQNCMQLLTESISKSELAKITEFEVTKAKARRDSTKTVRFGVLLFFGILCAVAIWSDSRPFPEGLAFGSLEKSDVSMSSR